MQVKQHFECLPSGGYNTSSTADLTEWEEQNYPVDLTIAQSVQGISMSSRRKKMIDQNLVPFTIPKVEVNFNLGFGSHDSNFPQLIPATGVFYSF